MPCVAGYAEIGLGLLHDPATRLTANPYASWIRNYGDEGYLNGVNNAIGLLKPSGSSAAARRVSLNSALFSPPPRVWRLTSGRWALTPSRSARRDGSRN